LKTTFSGSTKVRVAHRAKELVLLPDRIGHGAGSLAGCDSGYVDNPFGAMPY
jgi:hypothetical protein